MSIYNEPWRLVQNRIRGHGGREIDKLRGISPPVDDSTGSEAWIGSVTRVGNPPESLPNYGCSEVILPDGKKMFLYQAIALSPRDVLGDRHMAKNGEGIGVLIKYLDAQRQYGLQCHPTREWAAQMWGSPYGKEESWYVIGTRGDTAEPAYILLGFKEGVTREKWEGYYYKGDIKALENLCHKIEVKVGEAYFVGAGCPHALGEGCFVVEVQEPSDITVGALPYKETLKNRPLSVNVSEDEFNNRLLGSYVYEGRSYEDNLKKWRASRKTIREGSWGKEDILVGPDHTSFFSFTQADITGKTELRDTGFPQVAIILEGSGEIQHSAGVMQIKQADEIFLPYSIPGAEISGNGLKIVFCHPEGVEFCG
ncbi:MAG: class I mannose-6-phosphate isomerase [Oscillospiraceae bacterium]|nr:class I mannose-6-phosphate isomerase [Oscillospiraceae bacterium]